MKPRQLPDFEPARTACEDTGCMEYLDLRVRNTAQHRARKGDVPRCGEDGGPRPCQADDAAEVVVMVVAGDDPADPLLGERLAGRLEDVVGEWPPGRG